MLSHRIHVLLCFFLTKWGCYKCYFALFAEELRCSQRYCTEKNDFCQIAASLPDFDLVSLKTMFLPFFFLKYAVLGFVFLRAFLLFFLLNQTFLSGLLRRKPILVSLREKCAHSPLLDRKKKKVFSFFVPLLHCFKRFCSRKRCFARLQKVTLVLALLHSKRC